MESKQKTVTALRWSNEGAKPEVEIIGVYEDMEHAMRYCIGLGCWYEEDYLELTPSQEQNSFNNKHNKHWREVNIGIRGIKAEDSNMEFWANGKLLSAYKLDEVRFEANGNWGNKIYTDRKGGNALYKALKAGDVWVEVDKIVAFLKDHSYQFTVKA